MSVEDRDQGIIQVHLHLTPRAARMAPAQLHKALRNDYEGRLPQIVARYHRLASLVTPPGRFASLLDDARFLYVEERLYACITMCGVALERFLREVLLSCEQGKAAHTEGADARRLWQQCQRKRMKAVRQSLRDAGVLDEETDRKAAEVARLRDKYAHASDPVAEDGDAERAVRLLHEVVTAGRYRLGDYEISGGNVIIKRS